jgi:adenylate cyclase
MMNQSNQVSPADARDESLLTNEDLLALARTGRELAGELSLDVLLQRILETASRLTDSPETSIILRNEHQSTLYFAAATGPEADWILSTFGEYSEKQVPIDSSKAGAVYQSGVSLVENLVKNHFTGVDVETKGITKSMVCVPLRVGNSRLGVMQVLNKTTGDYCARDRVILEYFADHAGVAIRNAKLMESMVAHSGLYGAIRTTDQLLARMHVVNQAAHTETLSVLFADMRGFTQFCQTLLNPVLVQQRLSEFISMLSQAVIDEDGIVNKFLGDGVMALFQGEGCSSRAVKCAFTMVEAFSNMKVRWDNSSNQKLDFLDLGIGITTDQVILGGIGSNSIRDYTAIGTAVNLAAAFESCARNGKQILCDQLTYCNARSILAHTTTPEDFILKKPGQEIGVRYKCYSIISLKAKEKPRVFISHSHQDREYAEWLIAELKAKGAETWYSVTDIRKAISHCNWMVVLVSKNSANSKWISREVDLAITAQHLENRILPVVLDGTEPIAVSPYLSMMQAIFQTTCDDIPEALSERFLTDDDFLDDDRRI